MLNFDINADRMCPLVDRVITTDDCFDICMVIEDDAPKRTALKGAFEKNNYKDICSRCPYHEAVNQ